MTVNLNPVRVFSTGTGAQTEYDFGFKYINASDVFVELDGVAVSESDYTVTRNPSGDGGTITFNTAPDSGVEVLIYHDTAATQETVIPYANKIPKGTLENAFDKLTLLAQQLDDEVSRCVKVAYNQNLTPETELTLTANKAIVVNADGDGFTLSEDDYNDQLADVTEQADNAAASASAAATSASAASASASAAASSASSASTSASTATTQAGIATTQASNASTSASNALTSANNAATSESNAASSASTATTQAGIATTQAGIATTQASNASSSASSASTSASTATTQASNASTSASNAATSASNALTSENNASALVAAVSNKGSCRMTTTATLTATYNNGASGVGATLTNSGALAAFQVDGVSASSGDRVLVRNQSTAAQNGIYTVTTVGSGAVAWVLTRATDYDTAAEIVVGTFTVIREGTANAGALYVMTTTGAITVGTTGLTFAGQSIASPASVSDVLTGTSTSTQVTPDALAGLWEQGTDIASASVPAIPATGGGYFNVTGTTTITRIDQATAPKNGRPIALRFAGALTLTNNANIILPGGANITTAAGDVAMFVCESTTASNQIWRCTNYMRASGVAVVVTAASSTVAGAIELADQTEMEAATATDRAVTPQGVRWHPGVAKAWALITVTAGTPALTAGYNVGSITDSGVGRFTCNFTTAFSSANYACIVSANFDDGTSIYNGFQYSDVGRGTTSCQICTTNSVNALADANLVEVVFFGDQ